MAYLSLGSSEALAAAKRAKEAARAAPTKVTLSPVEVPSSSSPVVPASNTALIVGGLAAAAAVAFVVLKRKKG